MTVALAANPQMETAAKLIENFYEKNPDIKVKFQILPENQLRPTVLKDVATNSGQFDVVMIGAYEVPLWAEKGWIVDLSKNYVAKDTDWKAGDLIPAIKDLVSDKGEMYATPFYGSSSFMFYRKDLFEKAGLTMPVTPTWDQIAEFAAKQQAGRANEAKQQRLITIKRKNEPKVGDVCCWNAHGVCRLKTASNYRLEC